MGHSRARWNWRLQDPPSRDGSLAWGELVRWRHDRGEDVEELLAEGRERWPSSGC
jgi:hypothetical protein